MKLVLIFITVILLSHFSPGQNPKDYVVNITTSVSENPPSISFKWEPVKAGTKIYICRKHPDSDNWGKALAILPISETEYKDDKIESGVKYEYRFVVTGKTLKYNYLYAGIKCKEIEYRGKLILLVDDKFTKTLNYELKRLESDLIGDGWDVLRKDVSRNASVKSVKEIVRNIYNSDPENVNTLLLFGHIPVPYSGNDAFDGHYEDHTGAWPADLFYGDINDDCWTDLTVDNRSAANKANFNIPGDGKYDQSQIPGTNQISIAIGRVDFYNLPDFKQSETELLRAYLDKNHRFRHKVNIPVMRALIDNNFDVNDYYGTKEVMAISGWRNFSALLNSENVKEGSFFSDTKNASYIWSYASGGGNFDSCKHIGSTLCFVQQSPQTVFTALYGSYFGDWNTKNNFMRAALASDGWILISCWAGRPHYTFHQMGMGETIGYCVRATQNNKGFYQAGLTYRGIHQSLMGDPSLRMHIVHPVNNLKAKVSSNNSVLLSWNQGDDDIEGFYVYKLDTTTNEYLRISEKLVTSRSFEDVYPDTGNNYYMVRTLKLCKVASGSYYNLSQGVFDTIFYDSAVYNSNLKTDISRFYKEINIYPNPTSGRLNIDFGSSIPYQATFVIYDVHGKQVCLKQFEYCTNAVIDLSKEAKGVYILKGMVDNKPVLAKICLQ